MTWLWLFGAALVATVVGTRAFRTFAIRKGIVARPSFRGLHQQSMPRAGGVVFSLVFLAAAAGIWATTDVDPRLMQALVVGGLVATLFGFMDDVVNIRPAIKFLVQALLAAWLLVCFRGVVLADVPWVPPTVELALSWIALVWLMNLYNFIDGVDGMAASGAVFISAAVIIVLLLTGAGDPLVFLVGMLAVCSAGFLLFNWPPASIFMGDSGSLFLGYCFATLIVGTIASGQIANWTWLVIFGYFAGDTTTTTVLRIFLTTKWYGEHRSHAYQNLARILQNHRIVVSGVALYNLLWLLPLTVWSVLVPAMAPVAALLALAPAVAWTVRYGPRLSSS
jgi:Fuc2NAc and GlcNAc transferase